MSIVFYCQSCGSRFEVDARAAGKKGRCKKCGQLMTVPRGEEIASMAAIPALAKAGAQAAAAPGSASSWLAAMTSKVALAPLTIDRMPAGYKKPSMYAEDEVADSKPYALAKPDRKSSGGAPTKPVSEVKMLWRRQLGGIAKFFRWINQTAYLISVPFLMLLLLGALVRNQHMAIVGATAVVLLNIGRLISGFANLVVIPFRDGISQGVTFLIPPLTFVYLAKHWNKVKKPVRRLIEPVVTIGLVMLAFIFIPWLAHGDTGQGAKPRTGLSSFAQQLEDELDQAKALEPAQADKKKQRR
jgi:hypothetical protein